MPRHIHFRTATVGIAARAVQGALLAVALAACTSETTVVGSDAAPLPAEVKIDGEFLIFTHTTTRLTATTVNGSDSTYTWSSSDVAVATMAADGTVTGVSAGKVTVTATGATTKVAGKYNMVVAVDVPFVADWLSSGHADTTALAFNDWNTATPPQIPVDCARCHSTPGYRDYLGDDGTTAFQVDNPAPVGTVVECKACHNQAAQQLTQVTFPSGKTITGLGPEARCMTCHQGRESTVSVDATIAAAAAPDDDTASAQLGFKNIHYFAAGATLEAGRVKGGYQYAGQTYDTRFRHVPGKDTCIGCHDQHTLQVKIGECAQCHEGVTTAADLKNIRMIASQNQDYDGDGNTTEGIAAEIDGLRDTLLTAIKAYVTDKALAKICYSAAAYPYFFIDTNGNGTCEDTEAVFANRYASWTNRLLRAAYNYQVSLKDPGAFAHNAKYIIELLYDSILDVNGALAAPADVSKLVRSDPGHFDGAGPAARHWDNENPALDAVPGSCSRCHSGSAGYRFYLTYGVGNNVTEPDNGMDCATCHDTFGIAGQPDAFKVVSVASVTFPSNVTVKPDTKTTATSFVCMTCHQGRESKSTIDAAIAANKLGFRNVHYLAAGATAYGGEAHVGYEYPGKTYAGRWQHSGSSATNDCATCHNPVNTKHTFQIADNMAACKACHGTANVPEDIHVAFAHKADYDGDGKCADTTICSANESLADEIRHLAAKLLSQIQVAAGSNKICYNANAYPYFLIDTNGNGTCDSGELAASNGFTAWTPALMKAAHNYQISVKEPGAWSHNFNYMAELLIDSIQDLGGDVSTLTRP